MVVKIKHLCKWSVTAVSHMNQLSVSGFSTDELANNDAN